MFDAIQVNIAVTLMKWHGLIIKNVGWELTSVTILIAVLKPYIAITGDE